MQQDPSNSPQENESAINAAYQTIMELRQNIYLMGGNDAEIPLLDALIQRLRAGEITPEEAITQAHKIQDSKMDYH
ncbi:hypothetical protein COY05_03990 [Candidatus Peregrinibacteria bacterium CG_4_10_14_0_2_um_filter_38_24]|nr:MAG: hypothetical protein COY05_03990 [Candidatus Peregrinibacteria bacterium CG_4_10_14_0_2_um_filter_38_24]PJC38706.1 MAG: hypothetical protein CO044_03525 [Candidatus Peregrinibacteria bacterium CG_4_9_14_0_2_um_filter_38_9]